MFNEALKLANTTATTVYNLARAKEKLAGKVPPPSGPGAGPGDPTGQVLDAGERAFRWLGQFGKDYWENTADATARGVYDRLTDVEAGKLGQGIGEISKRFYTDAGRQHPNLRPPDPLLNPLRPSSKDFMTTVMPLEKPGAQTESYAARVSKGTSSPYGERKDVGVDPVTPADMEWAKLLFENPEVAAKTAGAAVGIGIPIAAGAFLQNFAKGGKPRSAYAAPVTPTRGGYDSTYNPSVESARAAAQYRHDLEEQKFRHKMELMNARQESRTPGSQGGGYSVGSMLDKVYGGRSTSYL